MTDKIKTNQIRKFINMPGCSYSDKLFLVISLETETTKYTPDLYSILIDCVVDKNWMRSELLGVSKVICD